MFFDAMLERRLVLISLVFAAVFAANSAQATGMMECDSGDPKTWQTRGALEAKLIDEGWTVKKTKVDGGCYEVYGTTPEGDRVEAYFDPLSFEKLLVSRRGVVLFKKRVIYRKGDQDRD